MRKDFSACRGIEQKIVDFMPFCLTQAKGFLSIRKTPRVFFGQKFIRQVKQFAKR